MFKSTEQKGKFRRILELEEAGFNIPKFFFIHREAKDKFLESTIFCEEDIHKYSPEQIFNIRTYNYSKVSKKESAQTPHLTDLSLEELKNILPKTNLEYSCLVDAETPDNGRIAGNIAIEDNNNFTIEFVVKEHRAMVRDINSEPFFSVSGTKVGNNEVDYDLPSPINGDIIICIVVSHVIHKAFTLKKQSIILEWTYFNQPSGIFYNLPEKKKPESHFVWWEYRKF